MYSVTPWPIVAVLFTMEDSSKVFAIGNIEQVAVADGTVDARRATGSSSAEYLRQLSMSQSAADKKMVTSTMKKMVGPEAE